MTTKAKAFENGGDISTAEKVANNTWRHSGTNKMGELVQAYRLHLTDVVIVGPNGIMLDSEGWQTVTTKERMSRFGAPVWSERGEWFIHHGGTAHKYEDRMILCHDYDFHPEMGVTGAVIYPSDAGYEFAAIEYVMKEN